MKIRPRDLIELVGAELISREEARFFLRDTTGIDLIDEQPERHAMRGVTVAEPAQVPLPASAPGCVRWTQTKPDRWSCCDHTGDEVGVVEKLVSKGWGAWYGDEKLGETTYLMHAQRRVQAAHEAYTDAPPEEPDTVTPAKELIRELNESAEPFPGVTRWVTAGSGFVLQSEPGGRHMGHVDPTRGGLWAAFTVDGEHIGTRGRRAAQRLVEEAMRGHVAKPEEAGTEADDDPSALPPGTYSPPAGEPDYEIDRAELAKLKEEEEQE